MWKNSRAVLASVAAIGLLTLAVWGCNPQGGPAAREETTIDRVLKRGKLRVGFSTFRRWAMVDRTGEYVGFEIDVARRLAQDMGVELELVPTEWKGIIPSLMSRKFDVIIGGMGITPERNKKVNFTIPYDYSGMGIVANKQKAADFDSLDDFNREDVIIVFRQGSTAEAAVRRFMPLAQRRPFKSEEEVRQELLSGNVHAQVASVPEPRDSARAYPDQLFVPVAEQFTREPVGFAVLKGDVDTLNYLNNWIRVRWEEGWIEERKHYWFGTEDWLDEVE